MLHKLLISGIIEVAQGNISEVDPPLLLLLLVLIELEGGKAPSMVVCDCRTAGTEGMVKCSLVILDDWPKMCCPAII